MSGAFKRDARDFAAVYAVKLTDRQHAIFVERLAQMLKEYYEAGRRDGEFRAINRAEEGKS